MMDPLGHLRTELAWLRHDLRLFTAMSNADLKWFGGSSNLQFYSARGVLDSILMTIRRLNDTGRGRGDDVEDGLESLHANLVRAGRRQLADTIRDMDQHKQVRRQADKRIAHAKPAELEGDSEYYPGLGKGAVHVAMLAEVVRDMSVAYTTHLEPGIHLDLIDYTEPWCSAVRKQGLPVLDFSPLDIFLDFSNLAPELRANHLRRAEERAASGRVPG